MEGQFNKTLLMKILATAAVLMCAMPLTRAGGGRIAATAQAKVNDDVRIHGVVTDKDGRPVVGATVQEKGTAVYAVTDAKGRFSIHSKPGAKLIISCIGFKETEILAGDNLKISLAEDTELLSEVVVVGYGKQKKSSLTGSVASVDVQKTLDSRPIADVGRGLQGAVAGLNVKVPTGEVGSDPIMKIRGQVGSIQGSSDPLILLDNVEIPSITMINPDDIKSITVLKDAAAASIYGSRAAFGVILINTKTAEKNDKVRVSYSTNLSWQNAAKKLEIGGIEAIKYLVDAANNRQQTLPTGFGFRYDENTYEKAKEWQERWGDTVKWNDPVVYGRDWYSDGKNKFGYRLYDGIKAMVKEWTPTQTHNLSVNGVSGGTSYNLGLGYLDQTGMAKAAKIDDFRRHNASLGFNSQINKWLSVRVSAMYSDRNKRYPGVGTSADPWLYLYRWSALMPIGVKDSLGENVREPVYEMHNAHTDNLRNQYFNVNLGTTVQFTKDWDLQVDYTYDSNHMEKNAALVMRHSGNCWYGATPYLRDGEQVYVDEITGEEVTEGGIPAWRFPVEDYGSNTNGSVSYTRSHSEHKTLNAFTTYDLLLGANRQHALKLMAGMNMVQANFNTLYGNRGNLLDQKNPQFNFAVGEKDVSGDVTWSSRLGFFGRVNYSYDSRYFIEANLRRDGSSKFPEHLRWKWFPSVSGGWIFTNERFMKGIEDVVSFGKIRASWGSIGDQSVPANLYISQLGIGEQSWLSDGNAKTVYAGAPSLVNADITWQMINTLDFGIDLRFWKNRIGLVFDWYQRDTENMIIPGDKLPATLGSGVPQGNYGNLRTRGWELTVDFNHRFRNGLGINGAFAISDATSVTTKGADWQTPWENRSIGNAFSTGRRYGDIYGYVTDRLFQSDDFVYGEDGNIEKITVIYKGTPRTTFRQTDPYPVYQTKFENSDKLICAPGDVKFVDVNGDGYIDDGHRTNGDHGDLMVIGNTTPRYEYSFKFGADWHGVDFSMLLQGIGKRKIWGAGQLAIPGYHLGDGFVPKAFSTNYWTPETPDAFYPRAWNLGGANTGFTYQVQSRYLLNMAYLRVKNLTLGYSLPGRLLEKVHVSKLRCYVSLENFLTFDHLHRMPIDPEAISGYSMFSSNYNLGRTGTGTPMFKSASFGVQLSF